MSARSVTTLLLVVAISLATAVHPAGASAKLPGNFENEVELTPEEEQEARELARHFDERIRATNDIGPIIDELFINDFSERLRQAPHGWLPWVMLDESLATDASRDDLRRYYVAAMNFYGLYFRLYEVAESLKQQSENNEGELKLEDVVSPEVVKVLLSEPTFAALAELTGKDESDERAKEGENDQPAESVDSTPAATATAEAEVDGPTEKSEIGIIKSLPQLNNASATLEKADELMRKRLASISPIAPTAPGNDESRASEQSSSKPDLTSLDEDAYGYPKDTPAIHVDALPFCLLLIRIDGQLKILSVSIYVD